LVNRPLARKLGRDLWHRKGSLVTLLIIMAIGGGAYVGMASVWRDLDGARRAYYRDFRLADFSVDLKRLPESMVSEAARLPNVGTLRGRVSQTVLIDLPGRVLPVAGTVLSLPESRHPVLNDLLLRQGGWFSGRDEHEIILNDAFARANGLKPGDRLKVLLLDKQHEMLVVGTAMSPEFVYLIPPDGGFAPDPARFGVIYATEDFLQESSDLKGGWNQLVGQVDDASPVAIANTLSLMADVLDPYGVTLTTSASEQPSVRYVKDELMGLEIQSRIMPALFLGVAALVLNVLLGRLVMQQRTVIGTLRALGYGARVIMGHYLSYGLAVGVMGGTAGVMLGRWIHTNMVAFYTELFAIPDLAAHFHADIATLGILISLTFAVAGTVKGVRSAARLSPADAMRPPPPERGGRTLLERIPQIWGALGFRPRMMLRTIFRNPFRSLVSLLAAIVSTALVFTALSMVDSLDYLMRYEFEQVAHQDFTVTLRDPEALAATSEVRGLPGVAGVEPQLSVTCDLANGSRDKRVSVIGLPKGHRLFTPLDAMGAPVPIPEEGLIMANKLAEILDVAPGDTVRLRPLIGRRTEVIATVAGTVETYLGLAAYADIRYLSRLLGEEAVANVLLGVVYPSSPRTPLLAELKARPTVIGIGERTRALEQLDATFGETMGTMIAVMVVFAGAIAFGAVLNSVLVSLSERQREVGTLRVLGYSPYHVAGIFAGESYLLNSVGLVLGLFAGVGLAHLLAAAYSTELYRFPAVILPSTLVLAAVLMIAFISLAQLVVYRAVKRLDWLSVLSVKE
jgi:putative ABC transport system permease protein